MACGMSLGLKIKILKNSRLHAGSFSFVRTMCVCARVCRYIVDAIVEMTRDGERELGSGRNKSLNVTN